MVGYNGAALFFLDSPERLCSYPYGTYLDLDEFCVGVNVSEILFRLGTDGKCHGEASGLTGVVDGLVEYQGDGGRGLGFRGEETAEARAYAGQEDGEYGRSL